MAVLGSTSLTGCNSIPDFIAAGSLMLFQQTASPTSWTKQTTHNNKALRVVTGTASPGGTTAFTTVFASRTPAGSVSVSGSVSGSNSGGSVGNTTLSTAQIPSHSHPIPVGGVSAPSGGLQGQVGSLQTFTGNAGGDGAHNHPFSVPSWSGTFSGSGSFTGTAQDFAVQYVDIIIASKD